QASDSLCRWVGLPHNGGFVLLQDVGDRHLEVPLRAPAKGLREGTLLQRGTYGFLALLMGFDHEGSGKEGSPDGLPQGLEDAEQMSGPLGVAGSCGAPCNDFHAKGKAPTVVERV